MRCRATLSDGGKPRTAADDGGSGCELFECPVAIAINSQLSPSTAHQASSSLHHHHHHHQRMSSRCVLRKLQGRWAYTSQSVFVCPLLSSFALNCNGLVCNLFTSVEKSHGDFVSQNVQSACRTNEKVLGHDLRPFCATSQTMFAFPIETLPPAFDSSYLRVRQQRI